MVASKYYSLKVVGAFDVLDREARSVRPTGRKDCALLAMLALTRNHRQTRTWLQERLWGDRGPAQAAASLRQSLTVLRSTFNGKAEVVCADRTWVWLDPAFMELDHLAPGARGEILRGFDLREEGFNDWLRDVRAEFAAPRGQGGPVEAPAQADRVWHFDVAHGADIEPGLSDICDYVCDSLVESLSVIGLQAVIVRGTVDDARMARATDMVVRLRAIRFGQEGVLSLSVTDGFGTLKWQIRREMVPTQWPAVRAVQIEMAQLFQDFAIRTEAASLRGARWSAYANGCQALMGVLVPGSMPLREIARCSEAAIAADEKGVYHALLGFSRLLLYGERELRTAPDADEVMQSFRTAMRMAPGLCRRWSGTATAF
jgi:hypothetical protein